MRDYETIASAITIAETGHLVLATLHTNDSAQTIDRIVDVFPSEAQQQVRTQLANSLAGVIYQQLLPAVGGGRVAAFEILVGYDRGEEPGQRRREQPDPQHPADQCPGGDADLRALIKPALPGRAGSLYPEGIN